MTSPAREYSRAWFASEARPFTSLELSSLIHHHRLHLATLLLVTRTRHELLLLHPGKHRIIRERERARASITEARQHTSHSAPSSSRSASFPPNNIPHAFLPSRSINTHPPPLRAHPPLVHHRNHVGPSGVFLAAAQGALHLPACQPARLATAAHQRAHVSRAVRHLAMAVQPRDAPRGAVPLRYHLHPHRLRPQRREPST
jgi:hypothetical protein